MDYLLYRIKSGKDKGKWMAEYRKRGIRKRYTGRIKAEAKEKMDEFLETINLGLDCEGASQQYGIWVLDWMETFKKPPIIRQSTWDNYLIWIRTHIIPAIGDIPLAELTTTDIQRIYNTMTDEGRSPSSIQNVHKIIKPSLNKAVDLKLISWNPASATVLPPVNESEARAMTEEEMDRFLEVLFKEDIRWKAAFITLLGTGLRMGELLALEWQNIDFEHNLITVNKGLSRTKAGIKIEGPKTKKSNRQVPVPKMAMNLLKELKSTHTLLNIDKKKNLVFKTSNNTHVLPSNCQRRFYQLRDKAGIGKGVNLHSLRHTFATRLLEAGENMKVVQELLGHAKMSTTADIYSHVQPKVKEKAVNKMDEFLKQKPL